jgi:hypothetical protein
MYPINLTIIFLILQCILSACENARKNPVIQENKTLLSMNQYDSYSSNDLLNIEDQGIGGNQSNNEVLGNQVSHAPQNGTQVNHEYLPEGFYIEPSSHANIVRTFTFFKPDEEGKLEGFNLDGQVSIGNERESCGIADRMNPTGNEGIDNQLGVLWPIVQPLVGEAVEALLANAVQDGRLLLIIELGKVEDLLHDDLITLSIFRGVNAPEVNGQGLIVADQTFEIDTDFSQSLVEDVLIQQGHIRAGPIEFSVPIEIFDVDFPMNVKRGQIDLHISPDGSFQGIVGGEIIISEVMEHLLASNAGPEARLIQPFLERSADLGHEDGVCSSISVAFGFEGTTAFVLHRVQEDL